MTAAATVTMTESDSRSRPGDTAAGTDLAVPTLEVVYDSFEQLLEHAGTQLATSAIGIETDGNLEPGDLARIEIKLVEGPALIRALGRVISRVGPEVRMALTYVDPASRRLIDSIRNRAPALIGAPRLEAEPSESAPVLGIDGNDSNVEWELDADSIGEIYADSIEEIYADSIEEIDAASIG